MKFRLTEEIWKEGNMYVAYCPELDISSCGEDIQQAKRNLLETIFINIEETQKLGTFEKFLEDCGLEKMNDDVFKARKELVGFTPIEIAV
ncbi:type II toxin-antitoxin system HicB family antitoxin [Thermodesulfobacteriota bacterium]